MSIIDSLRAWPKAKKITVSVIAVVAVAAIGVTIFLINRNMILATTMRLLKVEGTVNIEDATGTVKPVIDNIRFQSGDTLSTGSDGLASIGLDDTKIVTLQNDSSAQFIKSGKQIELKLKQGGVFFEVTEKLTDDETYEIETSNMTVGIRGTSGYVWYDESGLQSLVITDGKVLVSGHNPQTGETKTVEVCGGQQVSCFLYNDITEERTSIEFELKDLDESELPEFPLQMLAENPELMEKVCAETGWDKDELLTLVNEILDPNSPSPTPDAIIEITDTPTTTPTVIPTVTPTVTDAPIPLVSPTTSPTPTTTPSSGTTVTPTPGATTPTTTPTATPTSTPVPTVASYTVSFDMNGVGKAPADQTVENGKRASEPDEPSAEGYRFGGWYTNSSCTDKYDFSSRVTKDITLYAKWTRVTCTVRFNTDGIGSAPDDQIISYGGTVSAPAAPSAEGYTFGGWYINDDLTEKYDFDSEVTSSFTLFAKWTRITYTVDFDTDDLGTEPSAQTVAHGDTVSVPSAPSAEGYTFDGWYVDDDRTEEYDFNSEVTSSFTLYAGWTLNSYTVSFDANGHGTAPADQIIYYGDYVISPDYPAVEGYTCTGWYKDADCTELYDFNTPVKSDITIYAGWTINTYTVTFDSNGEGTAPAAQNVAHGSKVTPANPTSDNLKFDGWYTDPECTLKFDYGTAVTSAFTLYAKWIGLGDPPSSYFEGEPVYVDCYIRPVELIHEIHGYLPDGTDVIISYTNEVDENGINCYLVTSCYKYVETAESHGWTEPIDYPTGYLYFDASVSDTKGNFYLH
jgi:uncharacterized repeat protein (TIGR02543 family)